MGFSPAFRVAALVAAAVHFFVPARAATPAAGAPVEVARLGCTVLVRAGSLTCAPLADAGALGGAALTGHAARYADGVWAADVAVRNLTARPIGGADAAGASGVEVRLLADPATTLGTGAVRALAVPRYGAPLAPGETSAAQAWRFDVPASVEAFTFAVSVMATVAYPHGSVAVTPGSLLLTPAATQALGVTARTRTGARLPASYVAFSSSDAGVATVDAAGTVTGVAAGFANVTAAASGASATVPVCIDPGLAVGGVHHFTLTGGQAVCLASGGGSDAEYTLLPMNQSAATRTFGVTGSGLVPATGPPTPLTEGVAADARPVRLGRDGAAVHDDEGVSPADLEAADRAALARIERDNAELSPLVRSGTGRIDPAARRPPGAGGGGDHLIVPGVPAVGDLWTLNVAPGCSGAVDNRVGRVVGLSDHFVAVEDTLNPLRMPFSSSGVHYRADSLLAQAERTAWRALANNVPAPTDLDGNGRVVLFYTRAVNELAPPASSVVTSGYFTSRDLFSSAPGSCPRSNEGEMLYLIVPDPTGAVNSNVRTASSVVGSYNRIIGRELMRLTSGSRRIYVTEAPSLEEAWLDEGLANVAEELIFYVAPTGGLAPRQNINLSTLTTGTFASRRVAAFNTYANPNYGRLRSWLQRPDTSGVYARTGTANAQGSTWAFLRYAADRRGGAESEFWSALVDGPATGIENLRAALGLATQSDVLAWVRDWTVAMYTDDAVTGVAPAYTNPSWNYRSVYNGLGGFPLGARPLSNDVALTLAYRRKGGTAYMRAGVPAGTFATFATSAALTAPIPFSVVRTK